VPEAPHLIVERDGHVVIVTMNRPEARNAFGAEMLVRLADAWQEIDAAPEVRVAILTGAGGHFCAGSDLKAMASGWADNEWSARFKADPDLHWRALLRHYRLKKPLVAAVEGTAVAGGTEILQATDIRIAGASARFGVAEARWGLFPLGGSTVRLRRQIPYAVAMDLLLTGRHISAEEALRIGLIGRVTPDGEALAEARKVADQIAANGPLAVQAIKRSVVETEGLPEKEALARELEIGWPILSTEDAKEGPRAFSEKRKPEFKGR
jgi:enoyl-CoA hydratase